jgi:hypothetical protein
MPLNTPRLSRCLLHLARNPSTALSQDAEACAYAGERMTERRYAHLAPSYIGQDDPRRIRKPRSTRGGLIDARSRCGPVREGRRLTFALEAQAKHGAIELKQHRHAPASV